MSTTPSAERRKPGTRPKGDRKACTLRLPVAHYSALVAAAEKEGLTVSDYLGALVSHHLELPEPAYVARAREKASAVGEELPIAM